MDLLQNMDLSIFKRHKVGLCFSGGKDSLACLYLLRPFWDQLTVYWLNSGDAFREIEILMAKVRAMVPHFRELQGFQPEVIAREGWPSDVVPYRHTTLGNFVYGPSEFKVQGRLECCWRSRLLPMYEQMRADGVTCMIRGKRHDEPEKTELPSGYVDENGVELQFPIYEWTSAQVHQYLGEQGVELPSFYKYIDHSFECRHCTAFWDDHPEMYLKTEHPVLFKEWSRRMKLITGAVTNALIEAEA